MVQGGSAVVLVPSSWSHRLTSDWFLCPGRGVPKAQCNCCWSYSSSSKWGPAQPTWGCLSAGSGQQGVPVKNGINVGLLCPGYQPSKVQLCDEGPSGVDGRVYGHPYTVSAFQHGKDSAVLQTLKVAPGNPIPESPTGHYGWDFTQVEVSRLSVEAGYTILPSLPSPLFWDWRHG